MEFWGPVTRSDLECMVAIRVYSFDEICKGECDFKKPQPSPLRFSSTPQTVFATYETPSFGELISVVKFALPAISTPAVYGLEDCVVRYAKPLQNKSQAG